MGKITRKGTKGRKANLVRQDKIEERVSLPNRIEFRRLAILHGVYPKEIPKETNSPFAAFHKKDLTMINNSPMAWYIREHTAWVNKFQKKLNRKELFKAPEPKAPYAEIIRSRYPTFADALHDLDDALTTVALFAQLTGTQLIPSEKINDCIKLITEFHYYVARTNSLNYGFISVRGFHFEATIEGEKILWLIPHEFPIPPDAEVDYKVLLDFLELYEQLLRFVNIRLFIQIGMKYPPIFDQEKWNEGLYFDAIKDTRQQEEPVIDAAPAPVEDNGTTDKLKEALASASNQVVEEIPEEGQLLFSKFVFTISHEVPRNAISFVIESLGGRIIWDEESDDPSITHTIMDRPEIETRYLNRKYVQPQWVFDCLNKKQILDVGLYQPGAELPPHLSPFDRENIVVEGLANDEKEMEADGDESGDEIDEEIRRIAMEADYAEGIASELGTETGMEKPELMQLKEEMKRKKKEEQERMAAGQLQGRKMYIYKKLKHQERQKLRAKQNADKEINEEVAPEALEEEEIFEEEEEEKQE
ncbi:Pescadillo N-terminus family protein [Histomonas meleagridis]|uniref:Pescadillo N-terminus family protein n=1 Tax=Histomonas meleagridis TaxID=135588 RepID=UPI003559DC11|nr:Pescadillo N-terminus family protein [Histomonas meleagridis]KAH0800033.1 Pescadillo N-terminus family protein [Histomonas meleagridis]